jgi:O-acetylserine/cysteine efflux transporter
VLALTLGLVHFSLMFTGVARLDGAIAAVATQIQVVFAAFLSWIFFGDRIRWRRALGIAIALAGVAVIAGEPRTAADPLPLAMVIGAAFMWALANVQMKKLAALDGFTLTAWTALFSSPLQLCASLALERGQRHALETASWSAWIGILYMALMVGLASYLAWLWLLRRHPINVVMPFTLLVPVFGALFSIAMRDETASWNLLLGGALTVAGVGIIVLRRPGTAAPEAAAKSA